MALKNTFPGTHPGPNGPYTQGEAVTPSDSTVINPAYRGLFIGTTGNVRVTLRDGGDVTFLNIANATFLPVWVTRVWATNTSASNIIGLL